MTAEEYIAEVAEVAGVMPESIHTRDRHFPLPLCRYLVAEQMYAQGYSSTKVGNMLGMHHATILHGIQQLDSIRRGYAPKKEKELISRWDSHLRVLTNKQDNEDNDDDPAGG